MQESLLAALMPFLACAGIVTLYEMGDKSQILAMALATKFRAWKVMLGVLIATLVNQAVAVAAGTLLARVPGWGGWVKLFAALLFILFGLWALKRDRLDVKTKESGLGEVATVAIAFFFVEMGDKTQLATITLSVQYSASPLLVLLGTTAGMLIADAVGIFVGVILHRKLPENALRLAAAAVFIVFGLAGLWQSLSADFGLAADGTALAVAAAAAVSVAIGLPLYFSERAKRKQV
jgi:putative Ca2+/H+ antiporter (TMEM165/GDT1 family)